MRNWIRISIVLLGLVIGSAFASAQTPTPPPYPVCVPTATTETTNYSLTKPGHCALNWDTTYNTDLDLIDTALHGLSTGDGFPIVLGSTSITAGSTTTSITGLTVNGVVLDASGASTNFLNESGHYSVPSGGAGTSYHSPRRNSRTRHGIAGGDAGYRQHRSRDMRRCNHVCQVTVNGKGLTTAQTQVAISSSGGGSVNVNGSSVSSPNFNNSSPAP